MSSGNSHIAGSGCRPGSSYPHCPDPRNTALSSPRKDPTMHHGLSPPPTPNPTFLSHARIFQPREKHSSVTPRQRRTLVAHQTCPLLFLTTTPALPRVSQEAMASPNPPDCLICHLPLAPAPSRLNGCPFCGKEFRRVDGAKRHAKTCAARGDRPVPDAKRGRKVRACDACARVKVSCDARSPCSRCASRGLHCLYGRFCTNPAHVARPDADAKPIASLAGDEERPSMPFLLACTDPSVGPIDEIIITREPEQQADDQPPQSEHEHSGGASGYPRWDDRPEAPIHQLSWCVVQHGAGLRWHG